MTIPLNNCVTNYHSFTDLALYYFWKTDNGKKSLNYQAYAMSTIVFTSRVLLCKSTCKQNEEIMISTLVQVNQSKMELRMDCILPHSGVAGMPSLLLMGDKVDTITAQVWYCYIIGMVLLHHRHGMIASNKIFKLCGRHCARYLV